MDKRANFTGGGDLTGDLGLLGFVISINLDEAAGSSSTGFRGESTTLFDVDTGDVDRDELEDSEA